MRRNSSLLPAHGASPPQKTVVAIRSTLTCSDAIEVQRRAAFRSPDNHMNVGPASEDLPLTNVDRDIELEADLQISCVTHRYEPGHKGLPLENSEREGESGDGPKG
jgi:hypothetical protein